MSTYTLGTSEPLTFHHELSFFSCSEEKLDRWLCNQALKDHDLGRSKTFVVCDPADEGVVAYFTLSLEVIETKQSIPQSVRHMLPKGYPKSAAVPAILLGKLALDQTIQGKGLGMELLGEARFKAKEAADIVGGLFLLVDPAKGKEGFYEEAGFERVPDTNRMYQSLIDA
ncbi:GNAT family N-acetyltransferase [Corynebacterium variabile]|uniref:GNAT family N-acetyltransferase n=1 Tax=Corynebacterium variabile TaxID=1727 RepID=UPI0028A0A2A8|nr:GNAT family N-acetyltransferase [Corynebacterium variabile]